LERKLKVNKKTKIPNVFFEDGLGGILSMNLLKLTNTPVSAGETEATD
jgi:hypothetical protein